MTEDTNQEYILFLIHGSSDSIEFINEQIVMKQEMIYITIRLWMTKRTQKTCASRIEINLSER